MVQITEEQLRGYHTLHFVGVGGSGMFPLVQILLSQGHRITGSDNNPGDTLEKEKSLGVTVFLGHAAENIGDVDALVYSAAIPQDNIELVTARERGIPCIERSEMLGLLTRRYENCICVAGTHGKTTVTSMLTHLLLAADLDPSVVLGGKLNLIDGSGRAGKSDTMVVEACEYANTFLHLAPDLAVILNIDADHLEFFKTMERLIASFTEFASMASGAVLYNHDDSNTRKAVAPLLQAGKNLISFGTTPDCEYRPVDVVWENGAECRFTLLHRNAEIATLRMHIPGEHHLLNAVAACAAALEAGADPDTLAAGLDSFRGVHRRFEMLGTVNGITIADDYAHHPAEIRATLRAAQRLGYRKVWAVFQPFTFSRTSMLLEEFADTLPIADHVVMSAIMGGREVNTIGITTADLAEKIPDSVWFETFSEISGYILSHAQSGDLVLTMGCGDVYKCANMMLAAGKTE